ncbi:MAG: major capsid protein E [Mesorhizobium amorphae]|nr:MAG: major capsid protein E [Mesorhizobium amorphae]
MSYVLDIISAPEFSDQRLTETINIPPYETGRLAQLGVFIDTAIPTTYVRLQVDGDEITIIPAIERGGPSNKNMRDGTGHTMISIPHFPLDDAMTPADLQNVMAFGEDRVFQTVGSIYNQKLASMRSKHDATASYLDWGALRGQVIDAKGRLLCDLFTQFGITQDVTNFALGTSSTDVAGISRSVKTKMRKQLRGSPSRGVKVFAGPAWFDAYVGHASIKEALKYYKDTTANPARDDIADTFDYAGLSIERIDEDFQYRQADGSFIVRDAIADNEAIAIPLGTDLFKRYLAPADTLATANNPPNPGDRVHVSTEDLPHGKGRDIHTESNQLPICTRPGVIQKLTMS